MMRFIIDFPNTSTAILPPGFSARWIIEINNFSFRKNSKILLFSRNLKILQRCSKSWLHWFSFLSLCHQVVLIIGLRRKRKRFNGFQRYISIPKSLILCPILHLFHALHICCCLLIQFAIIPFKSERLSPFSSRRFGFNFLQKDLTVMLAIFLLTKVIMEKKN